MALRFAYIIQGNLQAHILQLEFITFDIPASRVS